MARKADSEFPHLFVEKRMLQRVLPSVENHSSPVMDHKRVVCALATLVYGQNLQLFI